MDDERGPPEHAAPPPPPLIRNFLWLAFGEGVSRLFALGTVLYLARTLGASNFGLVGSALALALYFGAFVSGGIGYKGTREVARAPADVATALRLHGAAQLVCAVASYVVLGALLLWTPAAPQGAAILVAVYALSLINVALNPDWALRGLQNMRAVAVGAIVHQAAHLALIVALVRDAATPLAYVAAAQVIADTVWVAFYYRALRGQRGRPAAALALRKVLATALETSRIALGRLPRLVYYQGDVLLLAWLAGTAVAGQFLASHRMVLTFVAIGALGRLSIFPRASLLAAASPEAVGHVQMTALRNEWLVVAPVWVCFWIYAEPVILLLYGDGYPQCAAIFRMMVLTVPIVGLGLVLQDLLAVAHRDRVYLVANVLAMLLHLGLAFALIGTRGASGAVIAAIAAECTGALLLYAWRDRQILPARLLARPLAALGAALAMLIAMALCASASPWLTIPLGAAVFAATAFALRAIRIGELREMAAQLRALASDRRRC